MPDSYQEELSSFNAMYLLWSILCNVNLNDQVVPPFSGFEVHDRLKKWSERRMRQGKTHILTTY